MRRYQKRADKPVIAVQLSLETDGFTYQKWGGKQTCRAGDWIVDNDGEVYTISDDSFEETYERIGPGLYIKTTTIWATAATEAGSIKTKEGVTNYATGDYIVYNDAALSDGYAVTKATFEAMYKPVDE